MKKIIVIALIVTMAVPASAASYGFNIGAIQGSVSHAIEQETQKNPDWFSDFIARIAETLDNCVPKW